MNKLMTILLTLALAQGCASYSVEKYHDDNTVTKVKIIAWFHKVEDVHATYGTFTIDIGSTGTTVSPQDLTGIMCVLYPHLCPPPGGQ